MSSEISEKKCAACNEIKSIKFFYKNKAMKGGYEKRCKTCKRKGIKIIRENSYPEKKPFYQQKWEDSFGMSGCLPTDYKKMYEFMKNLGFDPRNVHEDFCLKHNLKTNVRKKKDRNKWSYDEILAMNLTS